MAVKYDVSKILNIVHAVRLAGTGIETRNAERTSMTVEAQEHESKPDGSKGKLAEHSSAFPATTNKGGGAFGLPTNGDQDFDEWPNDYDAV